MKKRVPFDYSKLLGLMREKGYSQERLAEAINAGASQLSRKLNGYYPFTQTDIMHIVAELGILPTEIGSYFFTV